ncbi:MAG: intradiol ring-cleavage dioxygenase [Acidobacteria bacterium]|nr:intradiol ring-cleavage dioxygenase [Acidobacteriota bacterium]
MNTSTASQNRRRFLGALGASAAAFFSVPGLFAEQLMKTPRQGEGPFYPDKLPLDTDNDLILVNDAVTPAVGQITWLSGRILNARGEPIRNATVEIWQVDNNGAYIHSKSGNRDKIDTNFQGFGRFVTGSTGDYQFRTIKPVPYQNRTAHIHVAVKIKGQDQFTTQCYIQGEPANARDSLLNGIKDPREKASVIVPFVPMKESPIGELSARFDVVLG